MTDLDNLLSSQSDYFRSGATLPLAFRADALKKLLRTVRKQESVICRALSADLGKSRSESFLYEVEAALQEILYQITHLRSNAAPRLLPPSLLFLASVSCVYPSPRGSVLILGGWRSPFRQIIEPLATAVAAGNTVLIRPNPMAPKTAAVIRKLIAECFPPEQVACVPESVPDSALLAAKTDLIFLSGSAREGKKVMRHASEHLTRTVLSLSGKNPCIVDATANIKLAARRIVHGKFLCSGQTGTAPDYVLCDSRIRPLLIGAIVAEIKRQFGAHPLDSADYGRIVCRAQYDRLMGLIDERNVIVGGTGDPETLKIAPTLLDGIQWNSPIMQEEIFGPLLPILTYTDWEDVLPTLRKKPASPALYLFTQDPLHKKQLLSRFPAAGCGINDAVLSPATPAMPFAGIGESGMGAYRGREGFNEFSHKKTVLQKSTRIDLPIRFQPHVQAIEHMLRFVQK